MIFSTEPAAVAKYQLSTTERHSKMNNCSSLTFRCKKCGKDKATTGRKSLGWKAGFACKDCA